MSEEVPPVLLHLKRGDKQTFCIAMIVRSKDGKTYAEPYITPQEPAFSHLGRLELDGRLLELLPDVGAGQPIHIYRGIVTLPI